MTRIPFLLGILGVLATPLAFAAGRQQPAIQYVVSPSTVTAGRTLVVRFQTRAKIRQAELRWDGRVVPFYSEPDGSWNAWVGVPVIERPGMKTPSLILHSDHHSYEKSITFAVIEGTYPVSRVKLSAQDDRLVSSGQLAKDTKTLKDIYTSCRIRKRMWEGAFKRPAAGTVSSFFGARRAYGDRVTRNAHSGMDIANQEGTPVYAPSRGRVVFSDWLDSFGHTVVLEHGQGIFSYYLHMRKRLVQKGARVETGDRLGEMGSKGISTGPHLHWSIVAGGIRVDPQEWMERYFQ